MNKSIGYIFCVGVVLLLACRPLVAITNPAGGASEYAKATKLLTQGKNFVEAIALLQEAVTSQPKNPDYHLALGCAEADRAASIIYANEWRNQYTQDKAGYPQNLADWKAAQKDPHKWQNGMPAPTPPPATFNAYTKDDGKPLILSDAQAKALIADMGKTALSEWQMAVTLSKDKKARANAEYTKGWGVFLIGASSENSASRAGQADALKAFQAASKDEPGNAIYWQSLGYAASQGLVTAYNDYLRALAIQPKNPDLWYQLYRDHLFDAYRQRGISDMQQTLQSPSGRQALIALQKTIQLDTKNGYPLYIMCYIKLNPTPYDNNALNSPVPADQKDKADQAMAAALTAADKALATEIMTLMDKAGKAPECFVPIYTPPVPSLLHAPWQHSAIGRFPSMSMSSNARLRALARDIYGVGIADAMEHNLPAAVHAERDDIRMGYRLAGSWPIKDASPFSGEVMQSLVGIAVAYIGYGALVKIEQKYGTQAQVTKTQGEYDAFKTRVQTYKALVHKNFQTNIYAQY